MIRRLIISISFCAVMISCKKDNGCNLTASGVVVPAAELATLQTYVAANHPTATLNAGGGFYYEIAAAGTGSVMPAVCSDVRVKYAGYLTNGFKFDEETTGITFKLGQLIPGWQRGLPLIKAGGSINLYLPPSLGYGSSAVGTIPANSILIFNIQLLDVQN
ncbi:MAG: FKBP-type peptidyl-prolyl cis-trans isomerase [Ferruginibacter sp.]|nr:FKBP-type peptidyl-prolyl cis-trans isomerase [Ferruginibacter sp.]